MLILINLIYIQVNSLRQCNPRLNQQQQVQGNQNMRVENSSIQCFQTGEQISKITLDSNAKNNVFVEGLDGANFQTGSGDQSASDDSFTLCYQHYLFNTESGMYTCKYCKKNFDQERQSRIKRQLIRHLRYHHTMLYFPQKASGTSERAMLLDINQASTRKRKLRSRAYEHFRMDFSTNSAQCLYCHMTIHKLQSPAPLVQHLRKFHIRSLTSVKTQQKSQQSRRPRIPDQKSVQNGLFHTTLASQLNVGVGIAGLKLRWILVKQMGLTLSEVDFYMRSNSTQQGNIIYNLLLKNCRILQRRVQDPIRAINHKVIILLSQQMQRNARLYCQHIYVDILRLTRSQDFKLMALMSGLDQASKVVCTGVILFESQIYSKFESMFCDYLAEVGKLPLSICFKVPTPLFANEWDPRPMLDQLNTHLLMIDTKFLPYKYSQPELAEDGKQMEVHASYRNPSFNGLGDKKMMKTDLLFCNPTEANSGIMLVIHIIMDDYIRQSKTATQRNHSSFDSLYSKFLPSQSQSAEIGERILGDQELIQLSQVLQKPVFEDLLNEYYQSISDVGITAARDHYQLGVSQTNKYGKRLMRGIEGTSIDETKKSIECRMVSVSSGQKNTLKFEIGSDCWKCNCLKLFKTGIPCRHLIKILTCFGGSILYYVNARWLREAKQSQVRTTASQLTSRIHRQRARKKDIS